jgi:hypothetical protein
LAGSNWAPLESALAQAPAAIRNWPSNNPWSFWGAMTVLVAAVLMFIIPAAGSAQYRSADGFTTLAGFTFLAAALERVAEFALAPWWGVVGTKRVAAALGTAHALGASRSELMGSPAVHPPVVPPKVGMSGAAALKLTTLVAHAGAAKAEQQVPQGLTTEQTEEVRSGARAATTAAKQANEAADDVYVRATKQRPTIMLPMAAAAGLICYCLHLFLLHSLARSGVSSTHLAFVVDGLLTGFAIAGGAQPFHDLIGSLTTSTTAKKATAASGPAAT